MSSLRLHSLQKKRNSAPKASKRVLDRFDGTSIEELEKCKLPDILTSGLDMVFVGINPGLNSAYHSRYYAGPGNHFYKLLHASELTPRLVSCTEDDRLPELGIGLTNIVERPTRSSSDLKRTEIKEGAKRVEEKILRFRPRVAIFNGKGIYQVFANVSNDSDFKFGLQPQRIGETALWVVPSSSARCANFPRMADKLCFYTALRKYLDHLGGDSSFVDSGEFRFDGKCRPAEATTSKMWRRKGLSAFHRGGRVANKETLLNTSENLKGDVEDNEVSAKAEETNESEEQRVAEKVRMVGKIQASESERSMDFVNLIKRRLVERQSSGLIQDSGSSNENTVSIKNGKKLKLDRLTNKDREQNST